MCIPFEFVFPPFSLRLGYSFVQKHVQIKSTIKGILLFVQLEVLLFFNFICYSKGCILLKQTDEKTTQLSHCSGHLC
jgi:hypothetical protein